MLRSLVPWVLVLALPLPLFLAHPPSTRADDDRADMDADADLERPFLPRLGVSTHQRPPSTCH